MENCYQNSFIVFMRDVWVPIKKVKGLRIFPTFRSTIESTSFMADFSRRYDTLGS